MLPHESKNPTQIPAAARSRYADQPGCPSILFPKKGVIRLGTRNVAKMPLSSHTVYGRSPNQAIIRLGRWNLERLTIRQSRLLLAEGDSGNRALIELAQKAVRETNGRSS